MIKEEFYLAKEKDEITVKPEVIMKEWQEYI